MLNSEVWRPASGGSDCGGQAVIPVMIACLADILFGVVLSGACVCERRRGTVIMVYDCEEGDKFLSAGYFQEELTVKHGLPALPWQLV